MLKKRLLALRLYAAIAFLLGAVLLLANTHSSASSFSSPSQHTQATTMHHVSTAARAIQLAHPALEPDTSLNDQPTTSTGCGLADPLHDSVTTTVSTTSDTTARTYRIYLPEHYNNTTAAPLILNFHGYGASGFLQEQASHFDPIANENNAIVVYPNGTLADNGKRGWDTGLHRTINSNDILFVSNLLNQLQSNLCIKPTQIYATGFSNGGGFVNMLACNLSDRIAAFAPVSGSYVTPFNECPTNRPVPILEFHGTADTTVPYDGNPARHEPPVKSWLSDWAARDGCQANPSISNKTDQIVNYTWNNCQAGASVSHYKIIGGLHSWPTVQFPITSSGKTNYVSASALIWQFFSQHPLPATNMATAEQKAQ